MAFAHGKSCIVKCDDSGGTLRTITAYIANTSTDQNVPTADTTVFGANATDHVVGVPDHGDIQIEGPFDGTSTNGGHQVFSSIIGQAASVSLEIHPMGTTSTYPKLTGEATLTKYSVTPDINDAVKYSATLKWRGTATWGTN